MTGFFAIHHHTNEKIQCDRGNFWQFHPKNPLELRTGERRAYKRSPPLLPSSHDVETFVHKFLSSSSTGTREHIQLNTSFCNRVLGELFSRYKVYQEQDLNQKWLSNLVLQPTWPKSLAVATACQKTEWPDAPLLFCTPPWPHFPNESVAIITTAWMKYPVFLQDSEDFSIAILCLLRLWSSNQSPWIRTHTRRSWSRSYRQFSPNFQETMPLWWK